MTGSMEREMVKAILGILKRQCITCQRNVGLRRTSCVDVCGATWDLSWNCNSVTLGWGIGGLSLRYFLTYVHSRQRFLAKHTSALKKKRRKGKEKKSW